MSTLKSARHDISQNNCYKQFNIGIDRNSDTFHNMGGAARLGLGPGPDLVIGSVGLLQDDLARRSATVPRAKRARTSLPESCRGQEEESSTSRCLP